MKIARMPKHNRGFAAESYGGPQTILTEFRALLWKTLFEELFVNMTR